MVLPLGIFSGMNFLFIPDVFSSSMCSFQGTEINQQIWHPPTLPYRLQYSTIGRTGLNHRVRDGNGCVPRTHRHQISLSVP